MSGKKNWADEVAIDDFLNEMDVGYFSTVDSEGFPYTIPMNYLWYGGSVWLHTGMKGGKVSNLAQNPKVSFAVGEALSILTSDFTSSPCRDTQLGRSVLIRGLAREVKEPERKLLALQKLIAKFDPGVWEDPTDENLAPEAFMEQPSFQHCQVIEIEVKSLSGYKYILEGKPEKYRKTVAAYLQKRGQDRNSPRDIKTALLLNQTFES